MSWRDVTAISFDIGGTLVDDPQGPATLEIGELLGVGLPEMRAYLGRQAKRCRQSPAALARMIAADFARADVVEPLADMIDRRRQQCEQPVLRPGASKVLAELRRRGYRIALLSNVVGAVAPPAVSPPWPELADAILMSCDTGHLKPERQAFADVENAFGAEPGQLAHVGDSIGADICGALDAGWYAVDTGAPHQRGQTPVPDDHAGRYRRCEDLGVLLELFVKPASPSERRNGAW